MTPLHQIGEALRSVLLAVPLPVVRGLFLTLLIAVLLWIWWLPPSAVTDMDQPRDRRVNLRPWALLSLAIQIVIYTFL
ncbi:MAG: hypothetical protein KJ000_14745 [Pirellulaceae bacterium]|nr:hypothetical protein [Pirellulaceae bacterium]